MKRDKAPNRRRFVAVAAACALLLAAVGGQLAARDARDRDRARRALEAGEILPLRTILERVSVEYPGRVIEVELEREDGRWVYEIKLLRAGGSLVRLEVDARDGTTLARKERGPASGAKRSGARGEH
ncbi:MAG: PepSY domain-containing protein [Burkholderiaceae bacterium]|nr:PepSY domain-containing protein [Burkholderiaceae bacterium]